MILRSKAIEGALIYFYPVIDTDVRLDCSDRSFLLSTVDSRGRLMMTDLSAVFCFILAAFLVILGSKAIKGAASASHFIIGFGVRPDLRRIMLKDRANSTISLKRKKKGCQDRREVSRAQNSWHANRGQHFTGAWDSLSRAPQTIH